MEYKSMYCGLLLCTESIHSELRDHAKFLELVKKETRCKGRQEKRENGSDRLRRLNSPPALTPQTAFPVVYAPTRQGFVPAKLGPMVIDVHTPKIEQEPGVLLIMYSFSNRLMANLQGTRAADRLRSSGLPLRQI